MFEYFLNTIINNNEVRERLVHYLDNFPEVRHSAVHAAHFLVRTKNCSGFSSGVENMQLFLKRTSQELSEFYPLMALAAAADLTRELNAQAGIPESITTETLKDTNIWVDNFYRTNGRYGLEQYPWLANHYAGNLFKIGRLQYEAALYHDWGYVFKNRETDEIIPLSANADITASGHITGSSGEKDCAFHASFSFDGEWYEGYKIDTENGTVLEAKARLSAKEWQLILKPGDLVRNMHIPQGEKLDYEACLDSMKQADAFFAKHFSGSQFTALVCSSWLLDNNLVHFLPEDSNIVKFMRLWQKLPICAGIPMIFERVYGFGFEEKDIASAPENTLLQRNLKKYVLNGGKAYTTGGYIIL
jgi:hypothetical protein